MNGKKIWEFFKSKGLTDEGIAGLMGNLKAESNLVPTNLQNSYEKKLGFTDAEYTAAVDNGSYTNFVKDAAGYGLAQWTYWSRKQNLLNYAKSKGKSIGDLTMQLEFLYKELSTGYKSILNVLTTTKSIQEASDVVLTQFERPADQSNSVKKKRASFGQSYYDSYHTVEKSPTKSIEEVAKEVISGKWGNGVTRKNALIKAGYDYDEVQAIVNSILSGSPAPNIEAIAKEVIAGKWGNGSERKRRLIQAGYDFMAIQNMVNKLLK